MATNPKDDRKKYVRAFNHTMIQIWKEKIRLLKVWQTGNLHGSFSADRQLDSDITSFRLTQRFAHYGLFVNYGTGSNTPRGNSGDLGAGFTNRRRQKKWFSTKYFASVMNLQEFLADNLGKDACLMISNAFDSSVLRQQAAANNRAFNAQLLPNWNQI